MDLRTLLPQLLPHAIAWAEFQSNHVASLGIALPESMIAVARHVGVQRPERIRVKLVDQIPLPEEPTLRQAAIEAGLLGPNILGLTLGYSIFIVHGHDDVRLISHECRHVYQYEVLGSIEKFLPVYLQQIVEYGYDNAPLEVDARNNELHMA
ncbi:MAG: hypothetical protein KZQ93_19395 [Candidatus Thiodiazotropha sp. (ex Monitilora ramsayi)]|nr:hypothetical protein [Candidatus Thiodiazotropha sp. (ex Monitilora ramsayi)]